MLAIPNYARMNRPGQEPKELAAGDPNVNYAPGATTNAGPSPNNGSNRRGTRNRGVQSVVWMRDTA
jgi:hypothetical protein